MDDDAWELVRIVIDALSSARNSLVLPLTDVVEAGAWREFHLPNGEHVTHATFAGWVEEPPNRGLGISVEALNELLKGSNYIHAATKLRKQLPAGTGRAKVRIDDVDAAVAELLHYYDADQIIEAAQRIVPPNNDGQLTLG